MKTYYLKLVSPDGQGIMKEVYASSPQELSTVVTEYVRQGYTVNGFEEL